MFAGASIVMMQSQFSRSKTSIEGSSPRSSSGACRIQ
jgi:hypothetical protein